MKTAKITHFIIMGMVTAALIVAVIAYSLAWFQVDVATPYTFDIHANGVLYVYVDAEIMDNDSPLVPAVAIPGAIQEGLPYDVLTVYNAGDANPSYIHKVASVTSVKGKFGVNNEGYAYDKIPLPQDENGYTLYPVIDANGYIVWNDASDHSQGWQQRRKPIAWSDGGAEIEWSKEPDYEPMLNEHDAIQWNESTIELVQNIIEQGDTPDYSPYLGEAYWNCRTVVREGSSECTVHLSMRFKASEDNTINDYYDPVDFSIRRLYITRTDEEIAEGVGMGAMYGNSGVPFVEQSADKSTCTYLMYGSEEFYLHAEVYLTQPDELMNPILRGKPVYMVVAVSVEVTQFGENGGEEPEGSGT